MILRTIELEIPVSVPPDAHTVEGFRRWAYSPDFPERGRISLIDGEVIIDMSPERMGSHNKAKTHIVSVLNTLVEEYDLGDFFGDGVWLTHDSAELSTEPDAVFVSNATWDSGRVEIVPREEGDDGIELRGTPDWVLEVISPSSVRKDTQQLMNAYFEAGIPEYWLVDVRNEPIRFDIFVRGEEGYVAVEPRDGWIASTVFERGFRLECERRGVGRWRYKLHIRESPS
jgi:Uma2 family endonuclease